METVLKNHEYLINRTKWNIWIHWEEIKILAQDWEHWPETIRIIEKQNAQRDYLILLEEVKLKLLTIMEW